MTRPGVAAGIATGYVILTETLLEVALPYRHVGRLLIIELDIVELDSNSSRGVADYHCQNARCGNCPFLQELAMKHRFATVSILTALLCACSSHGGTLPSTLSSAGSVAESGRNLLSPPPFVKKMCPDVPLGRARCFAWMRTDVMGAVESDIAVPAKKVTVTGYGPSDYQSAYKLPSLSAGSGQTVGIVDAYNDPTATSDLSVYRRHFKLPPCTRSNGCLTIVNEQGETKPLPAADPYGGWESEESLDLDMVSAACPNCKIVLVEANTDYLTDLALSVTTAVRLGAAQVSNSYGGEEYAPSDPNYSQSGKAIITASAGDDYIAPQQPASFRSVVSVGGTQLRPKHNKRGWTETVWNDSYVNFYVATGSGCSNYVAKPSWQKDKGCPTRVSNDISASADCVYYAAVYDTSTNNGSGKPEGWTGECGTSEASPLVAAMYALNGNARMLSKTYARSIYKAAGTPALNPVTEGDNWDDGPCPNVILYVCAAGTGIDGLYSGPGGNGTPNGVSAL
jgi:Subtilase family